MIQEMMPASQWPLCVAEKRSLDALRIIAVQRSAGTQRRTRRGVIPSRADGEESRAEGIPRRLRGSG